MGILENYYAIKNFQSSISSKKINKNTNTNTNTNTLTNTGSDFKSILAQQNNDSKTNKLSQSNEYNYSSNF